MKNFPQLLLLSGLAVAFAFPQSATAQNTYQVGDIVENHTLTRRPDGTPVNLYDLEGKLIFIEWFAWWCPFCQAAAPEIRDNIVAYYDERGGTGEGLEIQHIGANLQGQAEAQTNNFVETNGIDFAIDDINRELANRFILSGGQPLFAIINGVPDSPSHEQWELLFVHDGFGNLSQPIQTFRNVFESVDAPEIVIAPDRMEFSEFFPSALDLGNDWFLQSEEPDLGLIYAAAFPWIYHPYLSYLFIRDFNGMKFAFDPQMGWLYLDAFPYIFRYSDRAWLFYQEETRNPRLFYNFTTQLWEEQ